MLFTLPASGCKVVLNWSGLERPVIGPSAIFSKYMFSKAGKLLLFELQ